MCAAEPALRPARCVTSLRDARPVGVAEFMGHAHSSTTNDVLCPRDSAEQGSLADRLTQASPGLLVSRLGAQAGHYPARVRLLFDQNLSPRLLAILADLYGGSTHVRNEGLEAADDDTVWEYAARHGFAIVSKDADFHQRSFLLGAPPREVIWIRGATAGPRRSPCWVQLALRE